MTDSTAQAFEEKLWALTQETHYCLRTLTALLRKFPRFSEKSEASYPEKIEVKRIETALQVAGIQLAHLMVGERISDTLILQSRPDKAPITLGGVSFDLRRV